MSSPYRGVRSLLRKALRKVRSTTIAAPGGVKPDFRIPMASVAELTSLPPDTAITFSVGQIRDHHWQTPMDELAVLASLTLHIQPRSVFEIGTFTGAATLAMARHSGDATKVTTLDYNPRRNLPPGEAEAWPDYVAGSLFLGTPFAARIDVVDADSSCFDFSAYFGSVDLVYIDGVHTLPYVACDTANALRMLRAGGRIIWHDYRWSPEDSECQGVTACVNVLCDLGISCYQIANTRFAVTGPLSLNIDALERIEGVIRNLPRAGLQVEQLL